MPGTEDVDKAM